MRAFAWDATLEQSTKFPFLFHISFFPLLLLMRFPCERAVGPLWICISELVVGVLRTHYAWAGCSRGGGGKEILRLPFIFWRGKFLVTRRNCVLERFRQRGLGTGLIFVRALKGPKGGLTLVFSVLLLGQQCKNSVEFWESVLIAGLIEDPSYRKDPRWGPSIERNDPLWIVLKGLVDSIWT